MGSLVSLRIWGQEFESLRARHSEYAIAADYRRFCAYCLIRSDRDQHHRGTGIR
jgi:hypothetical protein